MATIDERVVSMAFENDKFERNVAQSMSTLQKLDTALGKAGKTTAFDEINQSASRVSLGHLSGALDGVAHKFSVVQGAAAVALGNIASRAISTGVNVAKSLTIDPIMAGFHNYETQINAVQTILANTGLTGQSGLNKVNSALSNLNKYANLTVYNFSEMARNIGTFTAAGVKLDVAVGSIKGIANLAAMSGSTSQQASSAMYQLSQAIAAGQVHLQDWNSVVNAGIGGKVFQNALIQTGLAMGTIEKGAYKVNKATGQATISGNTFRQSIQSKPGQQSWLTSKVLTTALENFTGDMSSAKLASEGFSQSQIKAIQAQAKTAVNAATQIKTFTQLMEALKEEVGTAFAAVFKTIFGNINQAKTFFSALHTTVENDLTIPIYNFNKLLQGWAKLGGRNMLIEGLRDGAKDLVAVFHTLRDAFREVFPPTTAHDLYSTTVSFRDLMRTLMPSPKTLDDLKRTFAGVFAVLHIGITIVKDVIGVFASLIGTAGKGSGGILDFTGSIGDFLVKIDKLLTRGGVLNRFFTGLSDALKGPLGFLEHLIGAIFHLFSGLGGPAGTAASKGMNTVTSAAGPLGNALHTLAGYWDRFTHVMENVKNRVAPVLENIGQVMVNVFHAITGALSGGGFNSAMAGAQTAFVGGMFLALRKALNRGVEGLVSPMENINKVLGGLTGHLQAMQQNVKANAILKIAGAIGILAAGIFVLSTINPQRLGSALTAMAVGLGELMGAMKLMTGGLSGVKGALSLTAVAASLIEMSTAVVILAGAMKIFASMSWKDIERGLVGLSGAVVVLAGAIRIIPPTFIAQSAAILGMAFALDALAAAAKIFGSMSWESIGKGLAGMLGSLTAIAAVVDSFGPQLVLGGVGLIAVSAALIILSGAVRSFGSMSVGGLVKGIVGIGAALLELAVVIEAFPPNVALQAAGLVLVSTALMGIALAVKAFGSMSLETLAKGFVAIGLAIVGLAAGLSMMELALPGAAALLVAAGALAILGPAIGFIGTLNWGTILKGLVGMSAALVTLSIVGTVVAPGLELLGVAILPLSVGFGLAGLGAMAFAKALQIMGTSGAKGAAIMIGAVGAFIAAIPAMVISFVKGLVGIFDELAKVTPKVLDALDHMLTTVIAFIIREAPKFAVAVGALIEMFTTVAHDNAPKIIETGLFLLETLLSGISKNINRIVALGARVVTRFLAGVADHIPAMVHGGFRVIDAFLNSIANGVGGVFKAGARVIRSFINGVGSLYTSVVNTGARVASHFMLALANKLVGLADVGARAIIRFLNGMADVINRRAPEIRHAGFRVAEAMINGVLGGFVELWHKVTDKISGLADHLPKVVRNVLGIHSPSQVFHAIGENIAQGLANGIDASGIHAEKSATGVGTRVTKAMKSSLGHIPIALTDMKEFNPKITPILDLSHVKKHAGEIGALTASPKITPTVTPATSNDHAMTILRQLAMVEKTRAETELGPGPKKPSSVTFVQHNHSPKSLSTAEIYRRTGNQISKIRNELGLTHGGPAVVMQ